MELCSHQFFSFFEAPVADRLQKHVTVQKSLARSIIFEEGDQSDSLYLVLSGKVELCKRAGAQSYLTIAFAGENDFFGELGVLDGSVRSTRAITVEEATLARIPRRPVLEVLRNVRGKIAIDVFNRTIQHLRLTDERYVAAMVRKERMTLVGEMAETVIHDLRNPCHTILVSSELITKDHADERTRRACKIIQEQIQRMTSMVEEIQEFSRGTHQLSRQATSLTALLEEFAFLNRDYLQQNRIELDLRPLDVALHVDAGKLLRVLQNLVYNAAEALEGSAGKIIISGRILDGEVEICVRDNGPGIPEHIKDSLFEPFVTFGKNGGTGLGLAIAKSIVEAHGGHILYDPKRGDGAAFYVRLPRG